MIGKMKNIILTTDFCQIRINFLVRARLACWILFRKCIDYHAQEAFSDVLENLQKPKVGKNQMEKIVQNNNIELLDG